MSTYTNNFPVAQRQDMMFISGQDFNAIKKRINEKSLVEEAQKQMELIQEEQRQKNTRLSQKLDNNSGKMKLQIIQEFLDQKQEDRTQAMKKLELYRINQQDEVKNMNRMVNYSRCVTVRDDQLIEKKNKKQQERQIQQREDIQYEIDRLKQLKSQDELQKSKKVIQNHQKEFLDSQIKERKQQKVIQSERLREEELAMTRQSVLEIKKHDKLKEQKREKELQVYKELLVYNEESKKIKEKRKEQHHMEEQKVIEYQRNRDLKEAQKQQEEKKKREQKEKEVQMLREKQSKQKDILSDIDNLKAFRAYQEKERKIRHQERQDAEQRVMQYKEMNESRQNQLLMKQQQKELYAQDEKEWFQNSVDHFKNSINDEQRQKDKLQSLRYNNKIFIQNQIEQKHSQKKLDRADFLNEGKQIKREQQDYLDRLAFAKNQRIHSLQDNKIPLKYQAELQRMKVN